MDPVTAFILAGGKSSRWARTRLFCGFEGRTLLVRALETASEVAPITGSWATPRNSPLLGRSWRMYIPNKAVGGIHAALTQTATDLNLMVAVDMPFFSPIS